MLVRCLYPILVLIIGCCLSQPVWAQRYLTEFVELLRSSLLPVRQTYQPDWSSMYSSIASSMVRSRWVDSLSVVNDNFNALGFLIPQDKCNVVLQRANTSGGLRFTEIPFDANSFALIGRVNVAYNRFDPLLRSGRYNGSAAIVQPVADGVPILPENLGTVAVQSDLTGGTFKAQFEYHAAIRQPRH